MELFNCMTNRKIRTISLNKKVKIAYFEKICLVMSGSSISHAGK